MSTALLPASKVLAARPPCPPRALPLAAGLLAALLPALARAQPTFTFDKRKDAAGVTWSGSLRAGACVSGGNVSSGGIFAEGTLARQTHSQRLLLAGSGAFARSRLAVPVESDGVPGIGPGELRQEDRTTKQNWAARLRYDRFTSAHGSAYVLVAAGADVPAGKKLVLGVQAGYGIDLVHEPSHTLRLELGYDLSREDHVHPAPSLEIHSVRLFAGWAGTVAEPVGLESSIELLTNLNHERGSPRGARPFADTRVNAKVALKVKVNGTLTTGLQLSAAYDAAPAPRPPPSGASWASGYAPLADRLDTTGEWFVGAKF